LKQFERVLEESTVATGVNLELKLTNGAVTGNLKRVDEDVSASNSASPPSVSILRMSINVWPDMEPT
jgi:hypothetical protein